MKKLTITFTFCFLMSLFSGSAIAGPAAGGPWSSPGDFGVGGWSETFYGGGEGQPGNIIEAEGFEGCCFRLEGAALESVEVIGENQYRTIYEGGTLTLFNEDELLPWHNQDDEDNGVLEYVAGPIQVEVLTTKEYDETTGDLVRIVFNLAGNGSFSDPYSGYDVTFTAFYENLPFFETLEAESVDRMFDVLDEATITISQEMVEAAVDIKPGSCKNPFNVKSQGVLPVALLGSEDFDVMDVDPASIQLAGVSPIRSSIGDVSTTVFVEEPEEIEEDVEGEEEENPNEESCQFVEPDGFADLILKFSTQEIVANLGLTEVEHGSIVLLLLAGSMDDGTLFEGGDNIFILNKGKKKEKNKNKNQKGNKNKEKNKEKINNKNKEKNTNQGKNNDEESGPEEGGESFSQGKGNAYGKVKQEENNKGNGGKKDK